MAEDIGWGGAYVKPEVSQSVLVELRDAAGPPPRDGAKWIMVDLFSGEFHWYKATQRRTSRRRRK